MNKMKGTISTALVSVLATIAFIAAVGAVCFGSYVAAFNYGVRAEQRLIAQQTDNRNILAQYGQKILEAAQVPDMYRDDTVKVVQAAMQGRYGDKGSTAAFQWLKEQNPNLDSKVYVQLQQIIEDGRTNFENGQRKMIDQKRQYQTSLGSFWNGMWLRVAGYPKINLDDFQIVSTDLADNAFKAHKENTPIKLR